MSLPHILIVDDDTSVRATLAYTLKSAEYELEAVGGGAEALRKLAESAYDLLLLDLHMEPINGMTVFQAAREIDPHMVVIILTGYSTVESAVEALRLGAFDYLFKPVTIETLRQRVREGLQHRQRALWRQQLLSQIDSLRQTLNNFDAESEQFGPPAADRRFVRSDVLVIDRHRRQVTLNAALLDLTTAEFDLLLCLVAAAPEPLSPRQLVNRALGYDTDDSEARDIIKWHIHHLRRKIETDPQHPRYIQTVRHKGYLWRGE
jgi:DNA-binding response OmpR family regulator